MADLPERVARIETWASGHEDQCKERYGDIKANTLEIKNTLATIAGDLKSAVERIHGRIDDTDGKIGEQKVLVYGAAVVLLLGIVAYMLTTFGPFAKQ